MSKDNKHTQGKMITTSTGAGLDHSRHFLKIVGNDDTHIEVYTKITNQEKRTKLLNKHNKLTKHIVKCVNSHDALVNIVRIAVLRIEYGQEPGKQFDAERTLGDLRQALEQVGG